MIHMSFHVTLKCQGSSTPRQASQEPDLPTDADTCPLCRTLLIGMVEHHRRATCEGRAPVKDAEREDPAGTASGQLG